MTFVNLRADCCQLETWFVWQVRAAVGGGPRGLAAGAPPRPQYLPHSLALYIFHFSRLSLDLSPLALSQYAEDLVICC